MSFLSTALAWLGTFAITIISALGYFGVFFLMLLESTAVPLPSELIMPFAGYLAATGQFSLWLVILVATLGTITGSLLSYALGYYGGYPLVRRFGKYVLLDEHDLDNTTRWFAKSGEKTIFFARLIPVVRHLISIPAGIGKMPLKRFIIYTLAGGVLWNAFLAVLGYLLGKNWQLVRHYSEPVSIIVALLLLGGLVFFVYHHIHRRRKRSKRASLR